MKFQKGNKVAKGRPVGTPNKTTTYVRDMVKLFLEDNVDKIQDLLDRVAQKDPAEALKIIQGFMEYHIPKIQRHVGTQEIIIRQYTLDVHDAALSAPPPTRLIEHE